MQTNKNNKNSGKVQTSHSRKGEVKAAATEPEYLKGKQGRWQSVQSNPPRYPVTKMLGKGAWEE